MNTGQTPIKRMIFIDEQIRERKYPNCCNVSRKFEVNRTTIWRDIEYMKYQLFAPIAYDRKQKGYYYTETAYYLPSVYLTQNRMISAKMIEQIIKQYKDVPYAEEVKKILKTFLQSPGKDELFLEDSLSFMQRPLPKIDVQIIEVMQDAIQHKFQVKITYHSPEKDQTTTRNIAPYHILNHHGVYYLIAYCYLRKNVRIFAIHRILKQEKQKKKFKVDTKFLLKKYLNDCFDLHKGDTNYHIELIFSAYQARWIREREWHPSQKMEELENGKLKLSFNVYGLKDVKRWVLYHGSEVEVVQPEELRKLIMQEIDQMKKIYN